MHRTDIGAGRQAHRIYKGLMQQTPVGRLNGLSRVGPPTDLQYYLTAFMGSVKAVDLGAIGMSTQLGLWQGIHLQYPEKHHDLTSSTHMAFVCICLKTIPNGPQEMKRRQVLYPRYSSHSSPVGTALAFDRNRSPVRHGRNPEACGPTDRLNSAVPAG